MRPGQGNRRGGRRHGGGGHQGGHSGGGHGGHSNHGNHSSGSSQSRAPRSAMSLRNQIFDSNGPDIRVRGNAFQVYEKYLALAKDALASGDRDRVLAENYLQHAEHYFRIIEAINEATALEQRQRQAQYGDQGQQPGMQPPPGNGFYGQVGDPNQQQPGMMQQQGGQNGMPQQAQVSMRGPVSMDNVPMEGSDAGNMEDDNMGNVQGDQHAAIAGRR